VTQRLTVRHTCACLATVGLDLSFACNSRTVLDSSAFLNNNTRTHSFHTSEILTITSEQQNSCNCHWEISQPQYYVLFNTFTSAVQSFAYQFQSSLSLFAFIDALSSNSYTQNEYAYKITGWFSVIGLLVYFNSYIMHIIFTSLQFLYFVFLLFNRCLWGLQFRKALNTRPKTNLLCSHSRRDSVSSFCCLKQITFLCSWRVIIKNK